MISKAFQGYLGIFKDIDAYSATLTGVQLGWRGKTSPALFEYRKKVPKIIFGRKTWTVTIFELNFSFKIKF